MNPFSLIKESLFKSLNIDLLFGGHPGPDDPGSHGPDDSTRRVRGIWIIASALICSTVSPADIQYPHSRAYTCIDKHPVVMSSTESMSDVL
ncbi:MAG: hypothetical protein V1862_04030 [Methanobacteriota archaeon]